MKKLFLLSSLIAFFSTAVTFGQAVTPQVTGKNYSFQVANVYFEINPAFGGRVVSLKLDDKEILYLVVGEGNYGSTFWPAPQSAWGWPPITELDSKAYSGGIKDNSVNIISSLSSKLSLKFRKVVTASTSDTSITIDYYMINGGSKATTVAPWEITRVAVGGMIFFPDSGESTGLLTSVFSKIGDLQWCDHTEASPGNTPKLMANTKEGWIGWLNSDSAVFIKQYPNIQKSDAASGEQEVEYYYSGPGGYWELENQGKAYSLNSGDSVKWTVKWYVRKLPKNVDNTKGSVELANFVRKVIGPAIPLDTPKSKPTSSINNDKEKGITVCPNPANEAVKISGLNEPSSITFVDLTGKIVLTADLNYDNSYLNINGLKDGLYFYNISSEKKNQSGKLIIKR